MPLYMDVHNLVRAVTPQAMEEVHKRDLEVQGKHGVRYLKFWYNQQHGRMFCLIDAPSKEAANDVHREAHGLTANEIYEVTEGA